MAIATLAAYKNSRDNPRQRVEFSKAWNSGIQGRTQSSWVSSGGPLTGVAPTASVVPTSATQGALGQADGTSNRILKIVLSFATATPGGLVTIADRLVHSGGLDGTVTTAQTTNLPTAALTRKTSGVGVVAGLEIYTAIGASATTVTASYTNTTPTSGQTTPAATFGSAGFNLGSRIILLPLAAGDVGVAAVASVTVLATTGTAGNFGVTLLYPIVAIPVESAGQLAEWEALLGMGTWFPSVDASACLFMLYQGNAGVFNQTQGELWLAED